MSNTETFNTAINSLKLNKVRSFLTMLGVIIGVFAVVALVSLVKGFQNYITDQFNALGSNLIIVTPGFSSLNDDPSKAFTNNKLEERHVELLQRYLDQELVGITPSIRVGKRLKYKTNEYNATITAGNYKMQDILDIGLSSGRFFAKADEDAGARVVILGKLVEENLFKTKNPIGETIKIENESFKVVGVAIEKGQNFDDRVFMPDTTIKKVFGVNKFSSIMMKAKDGGKLDAVMKDVEFTLLRDLKKDDFSVLSQKDVLSSVQNVLKVLSLGLSAIAGISLLVGGIGIMNIMLVSVTERTREIGLRKALGASSFNIAAQFMIESILISVAGGLVGLLLGWLTTFAVQSYIRAEVPWWAVILSLGFSVVVGVIFGTYPAIKASRKNPIEALRYE